MTNLEELLKSGNRERVQWILNALLEAPYFYKTDNADMFLTLLRYKKEFSDFFEEHFGWQLVTDAKCARVCKTTWCNDKITPSNRDVFNFTRRDECIAFMLALEFFESALEKEGVGIDDPENLRFRYGELLHFETTRFQETFPEQKDAYNDEAVRRTLRQVMPVLERYRFLLKIKPPEDETVSDEDTIYECLPALWHYNAVKVARPVEPRVDSDTCPQRDPQP